MKNSFFFLATFIIVFSSCKKNPITGRNQLSFFSESEIQAMSAQQYSKFLTENKPLSISDNKNVEMVKRIGTRISGSVTEYFTSKGLQKELEGYKWEYNLVGNKEANAWCMPGGKIVVYTGLLPITQNENALAVVMGHEIAHAIAKHGNERMSQGMVQQFGGMALSVAVSKQPQATQNIFLDAYGVGSQVGAILPFSRKNELEADKYGLFFAAMAGYDPRESIGLWERMSKNAGNNKPAEFASTHPAESTRIERLKEWMPEALKFYQSSKFNNSK
jgi:predicted Zn-dependent protease